MSKVLQIEPLGFPWQTSDPFLFCAFHHDFYPKGNPDLGPATDLHGRNIGQDFSRKDGWSMYHGTQVPGFPAHPHCGFETITIAEKGWVDHSDSLGAAGRFGNGDVQWMTAGKGVQHSEMFPLLQEDQENELVLFQIWLNLPQNKKKVAPFFKMLWKEEIPVIKEKNKVEIKLISGTYRGTSAPQPAPNSWAAEATNEVAVMLIKIETNGSFVIPEVSKGTNRSVYFYKGEKIQIEDTEIEVAHRIVIQTEKEISILNHNKEAFIFILQGKPLDESVVQQGPFVANSREGIIDAITDFQSTQYGGWPWPGSENIHDANQGRFAIYPNGEKTVK